jgi:hypothetical protein
MKPEIWTALIKRAMFILLLSIVLMLGISEAVYLLREERISRPPQEIRLTIPEGTAGKLASGVNLAEIPQKMIFVVGDTLVVENLDSVAHELGPLWIPPGSSASLNLDLANEFAYTCSFTPSKYFGLTVKEATTWKTRLAALWYGVPPLFMFFLVYSFVIWPIKGTANDDNVYQEGNPTQEFHPEWGWAQDFQDQPGPDSPTSRTSRHSSSTSQG